MTRLCTDNLFDYNQKVREIPKRKLKWNKEQHFVFWKTIFVAWLDQCILGWNREAKACKVLKREEYYTDATGMTDNDEILQNMSPYERIQYFEGFLENGMKIDRELFQREVHKNVIAVIAHLIVGTEWRYVGVLICICFSHLLLPKEQRLSDSESGKSWSRVSAFSLWHLGVVERLLRFRCLWLLASF